MMIRSMLDFDLSIVIPIFNEEGCLLALEAELERVMVVLPPRTEVLLVDDGSSDRSPELLREMATRRPWARVVKLRRNFGQTMAMAAGFDLARGKIIVCMDADLQNDPEDIPRLLDMMEKGFDIVSGWRLRRQDKLWTRRLPSMAANWLIGRILGIRIHDYGCSLKAYNARVMKSLDLYSDMHRFLPALAWRCGARVTEITVNHRPRAAGKSKYGLSRVFKVAIDILVIKMIVDFSDRPAHAFGKIGALFLFLSLVCTPLFFYNLVENYRAGNIVLPTIIMVTSLTAFYFFVLGVLSDLIVRVWSRDATRYARSTMIEV